MHNPELSNIRTVLLPTVASTLEPGQCVHIQGLEEDPVKMWEALHRVYVQQQAGTRFNAYDALTLQHSKTT